MTTQQTYPVLTAALMPNIPHGAFRLYVILDGASRQTGAEDEYFPVTLEGLIQLHPGIAGRNAGATTIIKQVSALRGAGLLDVRAAIHRNEPRQPVLMKVIRPRAVESDLASVVNTQ
ncbi:hypothetical protein SEA_SATIS_49 [Streptomyces phage Satis]|nr:hypothetical protein SEA_SATIS_49 [Streptomyces phage Satis]QBZ71948.1 hypothetical protein SEA_KRADAL_49 [Streptomyces phage Kradal]QPL14366.1 hypothetical protein SEA_EHYELIMAYOE_49 [Streptomyces phage EhyElimayoE]